MSVYVEEGNSVYVDEYLGAEGEICDRMVMCFMVADSSEELMAMADHIGVNREEVEYAGTPYEHFYIGQDARTKAVQAGALEVTMRELVEICQRKIKQA